MNFPHFLFAEHKGMIPCVDLPEDYEERVPLFYKSGGREKIEEFTRQLQISFESALGSCPETNLRWNKDLGLTGLSIGTQGGFYLNQDSSGDPHFQEHNLGGRNGIIAYCIATQYVHALLRTKPID